MQSISFDEGYKEFAINGDENRVIRFNPKDFGILTRMEETFSDFGELEQKLKDSTEENFTSVLKEAEETVLNTGVKWKFCNFLGNNGS